LIDNVIGQVEVAGDVKFIALVPAISTEGIEIDAAIEIRTYADGVGGASGKTKS